MNNLIVITHKSTGEQKLFTGEVFLKSNDCVFDVRKPVQEQWDCNGMMRTVNAI